MHSYGWKLHQFDIKNAFIHGNLETKVYMEIPLKYDSINGGNKVCKLKNVLYELKQSPYAWFRRFTKAMVSTLLQTLTSR